MAGTTETAGQFAEIPRSLATIMRREMPGLTEEIIREVRVAVPEYARPMDGPYGEALRLGVGQALETFIDLVADPSAPRQRRDEMCRRLGQYEAFEGRTLDHLQAAYRIGTHVAWRRVMKLSDHPDVTPRVMSRLANAVLSYTNELADLSLEGYQAALARSSVARQEWHRRLLRLMIEHPPAPARAIAELAALADWQVPDTVTPVAVAPASAEGDDDRYLDLLDRDMLADLDCPAPTLIIPGAATAERRQMLEAAMKGRHIAIGPTVPFQSAAESVRWARRSLILAEGGIIDDKPVIDCERHLMTLWLMSDVPLANQIVKHQLAMMGALTPAQRDRLTETFTAWFETRGKATEIAQVLERHPQTIRKRMKKFEDTLGNLLSDPEERFALEVALRVMALRRRRPGATEI
jgi:hypothetical protein